MKNKRNKKGRLCFFTLKRRLPKVGDNVLFMTEEGCQGMNVFNYIGKVIKVKNDNVFIKVIKYNKSYNDCRDFDKDIIEKLYCPKGSTNMRKIENMWVYSL